MNVLIKSLFLALLVPAQMAFAHHEPAQPSHVPNWIPFVATAIALGVGLVAYKMVFQQQKHPETFDRTGNGR